MATWGDITESIDRFVLWTKESDVLSAAAKVALRSIPVVGPTLADIYDEADGKPDPALILEVLARVEALGANSVQQSAAALETARTAERDAQAVLTAANLKLQDLNEQLDRVRADMRSMRDSLNRLEVELRDFAWGAAEFDVSSAADQAALLVLLSVSLNRSSEVFGEQLRIADTIIEAAPRDAPQGLSGKDDVLWWLSRKDRIPLSHQIAFKELRAVTDRMRDINLRIRWLIRRYGKAMPEIAVAELDLHLSTWLAKYEYLRAYSDEHMALVFVGVPPTSIPFPRGIDGAVREAMRARIKSAKLAHLLE